MTGREEVKPSQTRVPRGLNLVESHELGRGNAIVQPRGMSKHLPLAWLMFSVDLGMIPEGIGEESVVNLRNDLTSDHSSSQDEHLSRG